MDRNLSQSFFFCLYSCGKQPTADKQGHGMAPGGVILG